MNIKIIYAILFILFCTNIDASVDEPNKLNSNQDTLTSINYKKPKDSTKTASNKKNSKKSNSKNNLKLKHKSEIKFQKKPEWQILNSKNKKTSKDKKIEPDHKDDKLDVFKYFGFELNETNKNNMDLYFKSKDKNHVTDEQKAKHLAKPEKSN